MKNNTLLIIGAAALVFYFWKKKQSAKMLPDVTTTNGGLPPNIQEVKSQTVNFSQLAPTPEMVMDLPGTPSAYSAGACNCNNENRLSGMPFVC